MDIAGDLNNLLFVIVIIQLFIFWKKLLNITQFGESLPLTNALTAICVLGLIAGGCLILSAYFACFTFNFAERFMIIHLSIDANIVSLFHRGFHLILGILLICLYIKVLSNIRKIKRQTIEITKTIGEATLKPSPMSDEEENKDTIWRCPRCETVCNGNFCTVCGNMHIYYR